MTRLRVSRDLHGKDYTVGTARQGISFGLLAAVATGVVWVVGAILLCGLGRETRPEGLLLVIVAALGTALLMTRMWLLRLRAAYIHGYHAGYHDQATKDCTYPMDDCDVLELAEIRARRITSV